MNWGNIIGAVGSLFGNKEEEKKPEVKTAPKTKLSRLNGVISDITNVYKDGSSESQEATEAGKSISNAFGNVSQLVDIVKEKNAAGASKEQ